MFGTFFFGECVFGGIPNLYIIPQGGGSKKRRTPLDKDEIVVNDSLMDALQDFYGSEDGEEVYIGMMQDAKKPFLKGIRTAYRHGSMRRYRLKYHIKK